MQEFHFIRPLWFLALLPLAAIIIRLYYRKAAYGDWSKIIDPQLMPHVLIGNKQASSYLPIVWLALAGILSIIALAGPAWERLPQPVFKTQASLVIALDLSRSMDSQDLKPSRLKRAHHKISDILKQRYEGQTALIVFAASAFTVIPLTDDTDTINAHLSSLSTDLMPAQGSRPDLALAKATELFEQAGIQRGKVLLIADGLDPGLMKSAAEKLQKAGHQLLLLGIGTASGAPIPLPRGGFLKDQNGSIVIPKLDENEFRPFGKYHTLTITDDDINFLLNEAAADSLNMNPEETQLKADVWKDQGVWFLIPVLLIAALSFRKGVLILALLTLAPLPNPAMAFNWDALWLNNNQRGAKALENGEAESASRLFNDPQWRAAAQYRAGDYESAVKLLENIDTPQAHYNRGNALARLGRLPEAIAAYEKTLAAQPEHEDARHNRDVLMEQMQNQQQNQQNQQNQNPQSEPEQQEQNSASQNPGEQQNPNQNESQASQAQNNEQQAEQNNEQQADQNAEQNPDQNKQQDGNKNQSLSQNAEEDQNKNQQLIKEQWLRRIPDDPGGLLRRKFLYQYQQQEQPQEEKQW